jgi:predicted nucleic acid-binding protein
VDAFDSDVLIFAADAVAPEGHRVRPLLEQLMDARRGIGSTLLIPEVLSKPMRTLIPGELESLSELLGRLELHDVDRSIAELAAALGAKYRLRAADAVHLATAVHVGADRFVTNNSRDFPKSIGEIEIVYPDDLA